MIKIKPILPCQSIKEQVSFYESLGFKTIQIYTRPNPYAVVSYGTLELHFYGSKKTLPYENPQMCYIEVDDVNRIYEEFTMGLKQNTGRIPRSGLPRISKLKHLADDKRFTITDVGGNTLYIGTPHAELSDPAFYRTIESVEYAQNFEILYDLIYSKEDSNSAFKMLRRFFPTEDVNSINVGDLDLAKILLAELDIHLQRDNVVNQSINDKLKKLFNDYNTENSDWNKILQQYNNIISGG